MSRESIADKYTTRVRAATLDDICSLQDIELSLFTPDDKWGVDDFESYVAGRDRCQKRLDSSETKHMWVVQLEMKNKVYCKPKEPVGYIAFTVSRPCPNCGERFVRFTSLAVANNWQWMGYGTELVKRVQMSIALQTKPDYFHHVSHIRDSVAGRNLKIQKLLSKRGFICDKQDRDEDETLHFLWRREWSFFVAT